MDEISKKEYIDNLNLEIKYKSDIEFLLNEFEAGKLSREEYIACSFLAHSVSYSRGFRDGFTGKNKR